MALGVHYSACTRRRTVKWRGVVRDVQQNVKTAGHTHVLRRRKLPLKLFTATACKQPRVLAILRNLSAWLTENKRLISLTPKNPFQGPA